MCKDVQGIHVCNDLYSSCGVGYNVHLSRFKTFTTQILDSKNPRRAIMSFNADWKLLAQGDQLQRSSVCANAIGTTILIVGGELEPRRPRDNLVHKIALQAGQSAKVFAMKKCDTALLLLDRD